MIGVLPRSPRAAAFGVNALSLGAAVLVCLVAGSMRGLRSEATTAAATALVVLTTGYSDDSGMLLARLLDTAIGIGVGLLVNLLVWPPLRDRSGAHRSTASTTASASCCAHRRRPARAARPTSTPGSGGSTRSTTTSTTPGRCSATRARAGG